MIRWVVGFAATGGSRCYVWDFVVDMGGRCFCLRRMRVRRADGYGFEMQLN